MNKKLIVFISFFLVGLGVGLYFLFRGKKCKTNSDCSNNDICDIETGKCSPFHCKPTCGDKNECKDDGCGDKCPCPNKKCSDDSDCSNNDICDIETGKCIKPDLQYYCVKNDKTHLNECITNPSKLDNPLGPYPDNTCGNICGNECPCSKGASCLENNCVSCSKNQILIDNANDNSMWWFAYTKDGKVDISYHNKGNKDIFFTGRNLGNNRWKVLLSKNGFDLDQGAGLMWKNFKLTSNNVYTSSDYYIDNKQQKNSTMTLAPYGCD